MLGLPAPQSATDPVYNQVRIGWQQQGAPGWGITDDITVIRSVEEDDEYNRIRDVQYELINDVYTKVTTYTRVWRVFWTIYGPNSFDNGRKMRTRLFDQDIHDQFALSNLYLVTNPTAPVRIPEEKERLGQWFERVDFSAQFNEAVTETFVENPVEISEIVIFNEVATQIADIQIDTSEES